MGCSFSRVGKNRKLCKTIISERSLLKLNFEKIKKQKLFVIEEASQSKEISITDREREKD